MLRPFVSFFASPFWASWADRHNKHVQVFTFTLISSLVFRALYLYMATFWKCVLLVAATEFVSSGQGPMVDNGVISAMADPTEWGKHRLWGAIGFGLAVLAMGYIIEKTGSFTYMFVIHIIGMLVTMVLVRTLLDLGPKKDKKDSNVARAQANEGTLEDGVAREEAAEMLIHSSENDSDDSDNYSDVNNINNYNDDDDADDAGDADDGSNDGGSHTSRARVAQDGEEEADDRHPTGTAADVNMPDTSTSQLGLLKYLLKDWSRCRFFFVVLLSGSFTGVIENFL